VAVFGTKPKELNASEGEVARIIMRCGGHIWFIVASGVVICVFYLACDVVVALPTGDSYETVSPLFKAGYGAQEIDAVSSSGGRVAFFSFGAFANTPGGPAAGNYMAQRGTDGWSTVPLLPPAGLTPSEAAYDWTPSLDTSLVLGIPGPNYGYAGQEGTENQFLIHNTTTPDIAANWEIAGGITLKTLEDKYFGNVTYGGADRAFCHIFFVEPQPLLETASESDESQVYELSRGCGGGASSLRLVGVNNDDEGGLIDPLCAVELGAGIGSAYVGSGKGSVFNAVADGGEAVFFTASVDGNKPQCSSHQQLFVRLGGVRTIEVSRVPVVGLPFGGCESEGGVVGEVPCAGARTRATAEFAGANGDGSIVFFAAGSPSDLYVARLGCSSGDLKSCAVSQWEVLSVTRVSVNVNGGEAAGGVQGVVRVSPDGSRVYYVATGVLTDTADGEGGLPVEGADNLYVYETASGETRFITDLCSGPVRSGGVEDTRCPGGLEEAGSVNDKRLWSRTGTFESEAQTSSHEGGSLVFSSYGQLTVDDTDTAKDVYRYEASTGRLERVSVGEEGASNNGNKEGFDATIAFSHPGGPLFEQEEANSRAVNDDGSRIVFRTVEPLSEGAVNGLANVYEWRREPGLSESHVSIVSCGCATEPDKQAVISPSGRDIFFTTAAGLQPADIDGAVDIYDAHQCTQDAPCFPPPPGEPEQCESEGCYGPLTNPTPITLPATLQTTPDPTPQTPTKTTKPTKHKPTKKHHKQKNRKRMARR
jgi:hypothetical protein